jgi:hypothetical protein
MRPSARLTAFSHPPQVIPVTVICSVSGIDYLGV